MQIRRLTVAHWRGLDAELAELSPGLNLIYGPNESGKSRLVEALRFALFESSSGRSAHKKALASWGVAPGRPRVGVELEQDGALWTIEKEFLGSGYHTVLRGGSRTFEGAEAEARLAELTGVGPGGRVELRPEDRGIWSLLWVDQGRSRDAPVHNEASVSRLHDHLTREIGEVAAGALGQQILRQAQAQRERFFTASRDAEKAILSEPREAVAKLRQRLQDAVTRRDAVAADADELDRQRAAEHDLIERLAQAEQRLGDVRGRHEQAIELGRRLDLYDEQVQGAESKRDQAAEALQRVAALTAELGRLTDQARQAADALHAAESERQAAQQAYDAASRAAAEADQRYAAKERDVLVLRRRRELARMHEQARELRGRLDAAAQVGVRISVVQQELASLPMVAPADLEDLRAAQQARQAARARLEGASASVELQAHRELTLSDRRLGPGETWRVLVEDEQRIDVDSVLSVTVRPGGGELPRLRDAAHDAQRAFDQLLDTLAVTDVDHAAAVVERRRDLERELETRRAELAGWLPDGRDAADAQLRALDSRLADEPATVTEAATVSAAALDSADAELRQLATARDERRARRDVAMEALSRARETVASRHAEQTSLLARLEEADARRRALPEADALEAALADAERTWRERVAARDAMEERFDALGGNDLQLDVEQAERAREQLADELQQVRMRRAGLQARLESGGDDGRHERVQELEAELVRAEAELAAVERQAAAARRLHQVLLEEYESARERLAQPVIARIRPYLSMLFPGAEVWLDEDLRLLGLRGRDTDQPFEALSGGAREQLSLLVRIGLAEVIGADQPWPLVLDDVLVNTDAERIRLVQRLLYQASRHMQILLFTCHGPLFDGLGADRRFELPAPRRVDCAGR